MMYVCKRIAREVFVCACVCIRTHARERGSVCVCVRERERGSVCVCVREREREKERE